MFAKNITEIKLFIKELDGKDRSDRNTYVLLGMVGDALCFVFIFIGLKT